MLSPCLFIILLAIGYFFIDQKTQTELINKCKKNKFMILGGLFFIYYFLKRNNVDGFVAATGTEIPQEVLSAFGEKFCYGGRTYKDSLEQVLREKGVSSDKISKIMKQNDTSCLSELQQSSMLDILQSFVRYEVERAGADAPGQPRRYHHMVNFDVERPNGRTSVASFNIGDYLPQSFKYNYEREIDPNKGSPESDSDRIQRLSLLGQQCSQDIQNGMTRDNSQACLELYS